ncbi:MAG: rhodanese-like domain-containing protein [Gammaproteobacteria bacterium]|nr:rhodanese-like domain-containing protein [Gammaproteobacteria bacterium]
MEQLLEFTGEHTLLVLFLMISFFLLIFTELRRKASGLVAIEAGEAVAIINNDGAVIDLRNPEAYARGHIVNARNIPYDEFDATSKKISKLKNKPIIAVCDAGMTSTKAVDSLRKSGFESAYGLKGGMSAWTQAGLPVVTGKKTKSKG